MSDKGSVFSKGGGGTNFEQYVQAAFLTTLITRGNAPCIPTNEIIEVAFQTTNKTWKTDDLLIIAKSVIGQHTLLAQIKHNIVFSSDNLIFKEVIADFWKDFNNGFDKEKDRLLIIKNRLNNLEKNHIKGVLNFAKTHSSEIDFVTEVNRIAGKKERLELFRSALKEANNNVPLTDKELWEFLKCMDVLGYDFLNQGSVDETFFLNLIKLSKSNSTASTEREIWNSLITFVTKSNPSGGSVTLETIKKDEVYRFFDATKLNPYFKSVDKLRNDGEIVLKSLKNTIGDFHLDRKNFRQLIIDSVNNFQFTIVTGKPGVGKSAEIKEVLENEFSSASIFVFRADQFNVPHLANVFSSQGVNETMQDVFSCISLIPDKIIFIDSLEKLLESNPDYAFRQLLSLLKEFPDIRIIGSSRKYAIDLISQKFGTDKKQLSIVDVLPLNSQELENIAEAFPQLKGILKNKKIEKLLESPKYLDFAISALNKSPDDYTAVSLTEFKDKLWNSLVRDSTNRKKGLPAKREDAFMEIAVNRAKAMRLFVKPVKSDEEAIDLLEDDQIIFQENLTRKYSPFHDILEDWALVKYVSSKYEEYPKPEDLFRNLGNEPAIRRAFRLWIEDYLIEESTKIGDLIRASLTNTAIERYWADEILIAIFKSDNCASFFLIFEKELLDDKTKFFLLNRCIHLLRTGCKESNILSNGFALLLPIGSGWSETILFIKKNIAQLDFLTISICNLLSDWGQKIMFQRSQVSQQEALAVKEIIVQFLIQIESGKGYWQQNAPTEKAKELVSLLYQLASLAKQEITDLNERAFKRREDRNSWRLNQFYESVINKCISGLGNHLVITELPELVVQTAWREWKLKKRMDAPPQRSILSMIGGNRLTADECWGIQDKHSFFPSGIYKVPLHQLLRNHPVVGLKFITEFINYSVNFYIKADCDYKLELTEIEIQLNDGTKVKQWGSKELWAAYRGISVTHYAIESLLMSLEKYLLETAERKTKNSKEFLKSMFNYLLSNSNNVFIAGVLTSVAIAYPGEVEDAMLPLLSVKEFYNWDLLRAIQETSALAPFDNRISFAQKERWDSNQLSHRKMYLRGLSDFIFSYQLHIAKINKGIHIIFDKLKLNVRNEDLIWKKVLTEIDIRNLEVGKYDEKLGGFPVQPTYDKDVMEFMNSESESFQEQSKSMSYSGVITKGYEGEELIDFKIWKECCSHYTKSKRFDFLYDKPISLAVIGLRDFHKKLEKKQKQWCVITLFKSITSILQDTFERDYGFKEYNIMEKEIALSSFHLLINAAQNEKERSEIASLIIYTLFAPFAEHEIDRITEYIRTIFFKHCEGEGKRVWKALIKYSQYKKINPNFRYEPDLEKVTAANKKEKQFIKSLSESTNLDLNLSEISLNNCEAYILNRAFVITPYYVDDKDYKAFIKHYIPLLTDDLKEDEDYSYSRRGSGKQLHFNDILDARFYLTELVVNANIEFANQVIDLILNPIYSAEFELGRRSDDLFEFVSKILSLAITKLDEIVANSKDESRNTRLIKNFWGIWEHLFEKVKSSGKLYFASTLLFDSHWRQDISYWKVFEGRKDFYHQMVKGLGRTQTQAIINVFSTVGEKAFLPEGVSWLVEIYKTDLNTIGSLSSPAAENMIKRLYYNHIEAIKRNKNLIEDFIWILDNMVDLGSSEAYLFRENVITYKTAN